MHYLQGFLIAIILMLSTSFICAQEGFIYSENDKRYKSIVEIDNGYAIVEESFDEDGIATVAVLFLDGTFNELDRVAISTSFTDMRVLELIKSKFRNNLLVAGIYKGISGSENNLYWGVINNEKQVTEEYIYQIPTNGYYGIINISCDYDLNQILHCAIANFPAINTSPGDSLDYFSIIRYEEQKFIFELIHFSNRANPYLIPENFIRSWIDTTFLSFQSESFIYNPKTYNIDSTFQLITGLPSGNHITSHRWVDSTYIIITADDILLRDYHITHVNSDLKVIEKKVFSSIPNTTLAPKLNRVSHYIDPNHLYIVGHDDPFFTSEYIWVSSHDSNLKRNWIQYYGSDAPGKFQIIGMLATQDKGLVMVGEYFDESNVRSGVILKLDADGNIITTSVPEISTNMFRVNVFPNPSDGMLRVEWDHNSQKPYYIELLDNNGRSVWQSDKISNQLTVEEDLSWLHSGVYQMNIIQDGRLVFNCQWVKQ